MKCPHCKQALIQRTPAGTTKVRIQGALELMKGGTAISQCFWCKRSVVIPLMLTTDSAEPAGPVLVVPTGQT